MATMITKNNFDTEVLAAKEPVLMDFYANWCGPCKMIAPVLDEISAENPDIKVCKVNVDEEPELAQKFGVMSIPMLVVMKDGELREKTVGVQPKDKILAMVQK